MAAVSNGVASERLNSQIVKHSSIFGTQDRLVLDLISKKVIAANR
jgi:hypothetical protein